MILLKLFLTFLKIGAFTFGGGYAMLPLIQEEVMNNKWASMEELINFVAVSESTPGPFAVNMATYIGMVQSGFLGAACATLGVIVPSFVIILIVARFYEKFKENRVVASCMTGLKSAVIGLIAAALLSMAKTVFVTDGTVASVLVSVAIYLGMCVLCFKKKLHPIAVIGISAAIGIAVMYAFPALA